MDALQEQVESIQRNQQQPGRTNEFWLVMLTETIQTFLEAAFSGTMWNEDCKKCIKKIGIPDRDQIHYPKLDGAIKAVLP